MFPVNLRFSLHRERIWRQSDRYEVDLFREKHTPQTECRPSQKVRESPEIWHGSFLGAVIL